MKITNINIRFFTKAKSTVLLNFLSLASIQGLSYILPLITLPYLVKTLAPEGYGVYGFVIAIMQYGCLITDYGFNLTATKQIAVFRNDKSKVSEIFFSVIAAKIILFLISVIVLFFIILFDTSVKNNISVLLAASGLIIGNIIFPLWLFQGKEKMGWIALSNISARALSVPMIFIFVLNSNDIWKAALITGLSNVLAGIISLFFVYRNKWIDFHKIRELSIRFQLKQGWHIFISTVAMNIYTASVVLIIGVMLGPKAVGLFLAADKIRLAVQGLISPLSQAIYPKINLLMKENPEKAFAIIRRLFLFQGGGTFLLSILLYLFSPAIITCMYGQNYQSSITVLKILAWLPFVIGISNIYGYQVLLVMGRKVIYSKIIITGGIVYSFLIIPLLSYKSINGAAISILITELVINMLMAAVIIKSKYPVYPWSNCKNDKS